MPLRWWSLCYTGKSIIAFNFVFLALITGSTPSSPWGVGNFEPTLPFGRKRVIPRKAAALTAGHSVALKFVSLLWCCPAGFQFPSGFSEATPGLFFF